MFRTQDQLTMRGRDLSRLSIVFCVKDKVIEGLPPVCLLTIQHLQLNSSCVFHSCFSVRVLVHQAVHHYC